MGKLIVEQIVTVDGYAAETDGGIDFFANAKTLQEMEGEQMAMMASVGAIVFGRTTYAMFADYWPGTSAADERVAGPINALPKFVVSSTLDTAPWGAQGDIGILRGDGVAAVRALRKRIAGDIIVWGSLTLADALLQAGEVDVMRLRVVPVLIGAGRSFAPPTVGRPAMVLDEVQRFPSGYLLLSYSFARSTDPMPTRPGDAC